MIVKGLVYYVVGVDGGTRVRNFEGGALVGPRPSGRQRTVDVVWTNHNMPESLSAFCSIVSLTAANTSRIFDVSVACVRLSWLGVHSGGLDMLFLLRVEIQVCPVYLIKSPQQIFGRTVDVVTTRVIWEIVAER